MKWHSKWLPTYMAISGLLGMIIGVVIIYLIRGDFSLEVLTGALTAATIIILFNVFNIRRKKDCTPDFDERTRMNIFKVSAVTSYTFMGILFISISILASTGKKTIPLSYLFIFFIIYCWTIGIGTFVAKRR